MSVYLPDPYPGRCRNLRPSSYFPMDHLRCLELEGHDSKCRFGKEKPPTNLAAAVGWQPEVVKAWVPPVREGTDGPR